MSNLMYQRISEALDKNSDGSKQSIEDYVNTFFGLCVEIEKVITSF
jgi:hypothetical protein